MNRPGRKTAVLILSISKLKLRALLLLAGLFVGGQVHGGLFSDDEAHQRIQQLVERVSRLEEKLLEASKQQTESSKQQTQAMIDLQSQIESQNVELRKLRGQNEELVHNLQDAEKRQKDFYVDLDTRVRRMESAVPDTPIAAPALIPSPNATGNLPPADDALILENRAFEAAYGFFKVGSYQKALDGFEAFLKKFPDSVHVPNVHYQMGNAYFAVQEYKSALDSYQILVRKYSYSPHTADAMLAVAACQQELEDKAEAKKTLQQVIAKFPGSAAADTARKRLKTYQ